MISPQQAVMRALRDQIRAELLTVGELVRPLGFSRRGTGFARRRDADLDELSFELTVLKAGVRVRTYVMRTSLDPSIGALGINATQRLQGLDDAPSWLIAGAEHISPMLSELRAYIRAKAVPYFQGEPTPSPSSQPAEAYWLDDLQRVQRF